MSAAGTAFQDGLGERRQTTGAGNQLLDLVVVHESLGGVAGFEAALRQRAGEVASFQHAAFPRLKGVGRLSKPPSRIVVATDHVSGVRLSDLLAIAERRLIPLEYDGAIGVIRQLLDAAAALHQSVPQASHGALAPERLMVASDARLIVADYVFGSAIERLGYDQERCWRELRVALPLVDGKTTSDRRADVVQIGVVALSLLLGRLLNEDEYPGGIGDMIEGLNAVSPNGLEMLPSETKSWLRRALRVDSDRSFATAIEAKAEFEKTIKVNDVRARAVLTAFLTECQTFGKGTASAAASATAPAAQTAAAASFAPKKAENPLDSFAPSRPAAATSAPKTPVFTPIAPSAPSVTSQKRDDEPALQVRRRIPFWNSEWRNRVAIAAAILVAVATAGVFAIKSYARVPPTGMLVVNTNPDGVQVFIDGRKRGMTPLTLELPTGDHKLELTLGDQTRAIPVKITQGGQVSQFVELPAVTAADGKLNIRTDPPGATVTIDGQRRGVSPLLIEGLTPGTHVVGLQNTLSSVTEQVTIQAGATASLVVPLSAPQGVPVSGWVSVNSPVEMQLFEDGRLVGSSRSDRVMMSVGDHSLQLVNETLGYRLSRTVNVAPGRVTSMRIDPPKGTLALNASPWAEVWVDGDRVGDTPMGNISLQIGSHDVLFRHPELGEQRHTVTVTMNGPARLSVDMRKRQ
ncbi:MAG TPA: PEGA domain-containing protein [Vicinamibacterales bacterium]|nr:PEGA domain-containing protein [Vicinamibacterales bacterium]